MGCLGDREHNRANDERRQVQTVGHGRVGAGMIQLDRGIFKDPTPNDVGD